MVHELGSERRETVRFLSTVKVENYKKFNLLREDQLICIYGVLVVKLISNAK